MSPITLRLCFGVMILSALNSVSGKPSPGDFYDHSFFDDDSNQDIFDSLSHFKNKIDQLHEQEQDLNRKLNQDWDLDSQSFLMMMMLFCKSTHLWYYISIETLTYYI